MSKIDSTMFKGGKGTYTFEVHPADAKFKAVGAVYAFTKRTTSPDNKERHTLLYIGQTESLKDRIPGHEKWASAKHHGANCICIHLERDEELRIEKTADLRAAHATPHNGR
jgi:hypothetical protein